MFNVLTYAIYLLLFVLILSLIIYFIGLGKRIIWFRKQWLFFGYVIVLLLATFSYYFLIRIPESLQPSAEKIEMNEIPDLWVSEQEGTLSTINEKFIKEKWSFPFKGEKLVIRPHGAEYIEIPISMEKTKEKTIEIICFETPSFVHNINISEYVSSPEIKIASNELLINTEERIELAGFETDFPFKQFMNNKEGLNDLNDDYLHPGERLLYILVPEDVDVDVRDYFDESYYEEWESK